MPRSLPLGVRYVRTTDVFSPATAPAGLSRAHRVASGVWARLVVSVGHVEFVFEDTPGVRVTVTAGETVAIPPLRPHHVEMPDPDARFALEFYRVVDGADAMPEGSESTGLASD